MEAVSLEIAKQLQELGQQWPLEPGTFYTWPPYHQARFYSGITADLYYLRLDNMPKGYIVLPRLDQILAEIRRLLPGCMIKFAETPQGIHCWVEAEPSWLQLHGFGSTDTEAAAQTLVRMLKANKKEEVPDV